MVAATCTIERAGCHNHAYATGAFPPPLGACEVRVTSGAMRSRTGLLVPRIVVRVYVFKADRADCRYLRHVLTRFCPVEVTGAARQDHDRARRVGLQLLFLELLAQADVENTGYDRIDPVLVMPVRHELHAGWQPYPDHVRSGLWRMTHNDGQASRRRERRERFPVDILG